MDDPASSSNRSTEGRARVTVRSLARSLNVSPSTISRALTGKQGVSPATRDRILQLAAQMGMPLGAARQAAGSGGGPAGAEEPALTFVVDTREGAYLADVTRNPFYMELLAGVEEAARTAGFRLNLAMVGSDGAVDDLLHSNATKGYLWLGYGLSAQFRHLLENLDRPVVLVDHYLPDLDCDAVTSDSLAGARKVAAYVASLGHRRVAILKQSLASAAAWERAVGFQSALLERGVPLADQVLVEARPTFEGGYEAFAGLIPQGITAVLCSNDLMALGVMRAAAEHGINVPDQLSVTGFDDISPASHVTPALTTVHVPKRQLGQEAVHRLLIRLGAQPRTIPFARVVVPTALVARQSTGPAPSA